MDAGHNKGVLHVSSETGASTPVGTTRGADDSKTWVPLGPVYDHVHELLALGMSQTQIGERAGVPPQRIHYIAHASVKRVQKKTAAAVMAVRWQPEYHENEKHPLGPTQRRIGALNRIGWSTTAIADEAQVSQPVLAQIMRPVSRRWVWAPQALAVQVAYEKMCQTPGPFDYVRLNARVEGWPPPQAWHEGELDDPEPTVLARVKARWKKLDQPTPGEQLYDLIEANDYTVDEVAERIGVGVGAVRRWVSDRGTVRTGYARQLCQLLGVDKLPVATMSSGPRPK